MAGEPDLAGINDTGQQRRPNLMLGNNHRRKIDPSDASSSRHLAKVLNNFLIDTRS
jgi:hypothetical protein